MTLSENTMESEPQGHARTAETEQSESAQASAKAAPDNPRAGSNEHHNAVSVRVKESQAAKAWILMVVVVLAALFFEMQGKPVVSVNYCVATDSDGVGASVYLDGLHIGEITKDDTSGLGGGAFRGCITNGKHLIELKKSGFKDFSHEIDMQREQFMQVDLQKFSG